MKGIDVARLVVESQSAHVYKRMADGSYKARPWSGSTRGWTFLDLTSAHCVMSIYNALNKEEHKTKFEAFSLDFMVRFSFKVAA